MGRLRFCDLRRLLSLFEDDKAKFLLNVGTIGFDQHLGKLYANNFVCLATTQIALLSLQSISKSSSGENITVIFPVHPYRSDRKIYRLRIQVLRLVHE